MRGRQCRSAATPPPTPAPPTEDWRAAASLPHRHTHELPGRFYAGHSAMRGQHFLLATMVHTCRSVSPPFYGFQLLSCELAHVPSMDKHDRCDPDCNGKGRTKHHFTSQYLPVGLKSQWRNHLAEQNHIITMHLRSLTAEGGQAGAGHS